MVTLKRYGLSDRRVVRALSADVVNIWHNDVWGLNAMFPRAKAPYLQLARKAVDKISLWGCELSEVSPICLEKLIAALVSESYSEEAGGGIKLPFEGGHILFRPSDQLRQGLTP
jgi:hypothetical protein